LLVARRLFDGTVDGQQIVSRTTQPILDAARILLREGTDPATQLVMRHEHQSYDALRSTIGAAAKLTVTTVRGKTVFTKWQPWKAEQMHLEAPPMRQNEEAGVWTLVRGKVFCMSRRSQKWLRCLPPCRLILF
jgi:hypothetical protein